MTTVPNNLVRTLGVLGLELAAALALVLVVVATTAPSGACCGAGLRIVRAAITIAGFTLAAATVRVSRRGTHGWFEIASVGAAAGLLAFLA